MEYIEGADWYFAHPAADPARPLPSSEHRQRVYVRHDVILAAGVFNTPQLLMLSGIGPAAELAVAGFQIEDTAALRDRRPVVRILPGVGQNLQDRYEAVVVSQMTQDFGLLDSALLATDERDPHFRRWRDKRKGIYTSNGFVIGLAKKSAPALAEPDLYCFGLAGFFKGYEPKYAQQLLKDGQRNWFTWGILKAHSNNRYGSVKLRSADPRDVPEINFRSFDDDPTAEGWEDDLNALVEGIKFARQMNKARSFGVYSPTSICRGRTCKPTRNCTTGSNAKPGATTARARAPSVRRKRGACSTAGFACTVPKTCGWSTRRCFPRSPVCSLPRPFT